MLNLLQIGERTWERVRSTQPADSGVEDYYRFLYDERKNVRVGYDGGELDWLLVAERLGETLDVKLLVLTGRTSLADVISSFPSLFGQFTTLKYTRGLTKNRRCYSHRTANYRKLWETTLKLCKDRAQ